MTSTDSTLDRLTEIAQIAAPLARAFSDAGYQLYAVGGSVRDALVGGPLGELEEIDFTTDARPDEIARLMAPLCGALWEQGRACCTIG